MEKEDKTVCITHTEGNADKTELLPKDKRLERYR